LHSWDGQLASITTGGSTVSFSYDALGRRETRTAGGTTTQFLSSGSQVYLEAVGSSVTAKYGYGNALVRKDGEYPHLRRVG
jgi:YD repeat-containing protein